MNFQLTSAQQVIKDKAVDFVKTICGPMERDWPLSDFEATPEQIQYLRDKFNEYGFRGLAIPKESGGKGLGTLAKCLVYEQLKSSFVTTGNTALWPGYIDPPPALFRAPAAQREKYLQPILDGTKMYHIAISEPGTGSDAAAITTTARRDGDSFILSGVKRWTQDPTEPYVKPDYFVVYAVTGPGAGYRGISSFLVDYPSPSIRVIRKMATAAPGTVLGKVVDLEFSECRVPAANLLGELGGGFATFNEQLNRNRAVIAAGAVGIANRCLDIATHYAQQRVTFGAPLAERQAIQWMLAESAIEISAGRLLAYQAADKIDRGEDVRVEAAMAKAYCPRMACRVIDHTIQILGGLGFIADSRLRDVYSHQRIMCVAEGSEEAMKLTIARDVLKGWGAAEASNPSYFDRLLNSTESQLTP
jgi:alkylation response protein AidB-like acyl-CoA dehydrogenase